MNTFDGADLIRMTEDSGRVDFLDIDRGNDRARMVLGAQNGSGNANPIAGDGVDSLTMSRNSLVGRLRDRGGVIVLMSATLRIVKVDVDGGGSVKMRGAASAKQFKIGNGAYCFLSQTGFIEPIFCFNSTLQSNNGTGNVAKISGQTEIAPKRNISQ